jgi:predicted membrane protein
MDIAIILLRIISIISMVIIIRYITKYIAPLDMKMLYIEQEWENKLNRLSLLWGILGIVMMMFSDLSFLRNNTELMWKELQNFLLYWGLFSWFVGCGFEARKRWRNFAWGLLGLFPLMIGAFFIPMLKDHSNVVLRQRVLNTK